MVVPKARKLDSGSWFIQLRLGGESISVTARTEKDCIKEAQLLKAAHLAGKREALPNNNSITLGQAMDKYIASRDNILSPATVRGYNTIRNNRFQSEIDTPIKKIKDWQTVCNVEAALCSAKTLKNSWGLVKSVLRYAGYTAPKVTLAQVVKTERPWLEPDQIPLFQKAIEGDSCEIQMLLALHGLRRSEICAVNSWDKIDLNSDLIHIRGSVVPDKNHRLIQKKTNKNTDSRRTIPIMIPRLKVLLVLARESESPIIDKHPHTIWKHVNKACVNAELPEVGIQGLRRSFASLCYYLGLSERETMELGGWSDAETMRKIYIHLAKNAKVKAENKVSEFFNNANEIAN